MTSQATRSPGSSKPVGISVRDVHFAYPGRAAPDVLCGVSLDIAAGERVAVLGPNGAGKSTLMLHLNGILVPQRGTVSVGGEVISRATVREIRRQLGLVFQNPDDQLFSATVAADVAFGPVNYGVRGDELTARTAAALAQVGLDDYADCSPQRLSVGQKRRAAIAGVLAMDAGAIVLDEPTADLDPASRRALSQTLAGLDATVVVVTHDLPYALETCPRSVILDAGRIVADDPTRDLLCNDALLRRHDLELPWGFDPLSAARRR